MLISSKKQRQQVIREVQRQRNVDRTRQEYTDCIIADCKSSPFFEKIKKNYKVAENITF